MHKGLYGMFIVDPRHARPAADELVMVMNGFDTNFDADNEVYAVNTVAHHFMHEPIRVEVGALVRMYLVNVTEFDLINSLHLHGMFFDVFRTGTSLTHVGADRHRDAVPGGARDPRDALPLSGRDSCSTRTRASSPSSDGWGCSKRGCAVIPRRRAPVAARPLLAALIAAIVHFEPAERLRPEGMPPVERLTIDRATLAADGIHLSVMNDGPDPVTIAQVTVDDAYWAFTTERKTL